MIVGVHPEATLGTFTNVPHSDGCRKSVTLVQGINDIDPGAAQHLSRYPVAASTVPYSRLLWLPPGGSPGRLLLDQSPIYLNLNSPTFGQGDWSGFQASGTLQGNAVLQSECECEWQDLHAHGAVSLDGSGDYVSTNFTTRRNYVTNPNFEVDATLWSGTGATVTRVTSQAKFGSASLEVDCAGSTGGEGALTNPSLTVPASTQYTASVWVKAPVASTVFLSLQERDSGEAQVGITDKQHVGTGDWARVEVTRTFGATGVKARLFFRTNGTQNITFYLDGAMLQAASAATAYFDGSGYDDGTGTFVTGTGLTGWLGTAHASASDKGCFANGTVRTFVALIDRDAAAGRDTILAGNQADRPHWRFGGANHDLEWRAENGEGTFHSYTVADSTVPLLVGLEWDGSTTIATTFVDGARVDQDTLAAHQFGAGNSLVIGEEVSNHWWDGLIGPVAVIPSALTDAEHLAIAGAFNLA